MTKILFLIQGYDMPSSRIRIVNLIDRLKDYGYFVDCIKYPKKFKDKLALVKKLSDYDVVYLQKKLPNFIDALVLRLFIKKLVYDFDDAVYGKHEKYKKQRSFSNELKFVNIIRKADLVVAGNKFLAEKAALYNKHVEIVPSVVPVENVPVHDYSSPGNKFVVGWVGGNINLGQLELLSDVFRKLQDEIPLEVRVICDKPANMDGVNQKFIPWDINTQDSEISEFDAGVMPLPPSSYAKCKCAYKSIQYMGAGVVPVVSDVGVNSDVVVDSETGYVAADIDDFYNKLKFIYQHPDEAEAIGHKARERAMSKYSVDAACGLLDKIFKRLVQ